MSLSTGIIQGSSAIAAMPWAQLQRPWCFTSERNGGGSVATVAFRSVKLWRSVPVSVPVTVSARNPGASCVAFAAAGDAAAEGTRMEPAETILSGEWPQSFSILNYEDLTSYFEPMIFKPDAQPSALLGEVMSNIMYTATEDQLLEEIDLYFNEISGVPVIDQDNKCIGVLSKKDRARASQGLKSTVGEVMSSPAITLTPEKTVLEAAATMLRMKIHRIPIVNEDNEVVGIVTRTDIFNALEGLPS